MNTIKSLLALYVKIGGSLTDTYDGIAGGIEVGDYLLTTDALKAIFIKCGGSLSTVYSDISAVTVGNYALIPEVIGAIAKVAKLYVAPTLESLDVTPITSAQTITPNEGVDGFSDVDVAAVTAAIDANIVAENIKKDVVILGVTGSYEGGAES